MAEHTEKGGEPPVKLEMASQARFLAAARAMINNLAQRLGFTEIHCGQISLAVDEALCNIINHGYDKNPNGRIWLNVWTVDSGKPAIRIVIEDRAKQVDPSTIKSRNLEDIRPGGLGVYIIREVMDEVKYEKREGGGMRVTMMKRLPVEPNSSASCESSADCAPTTAATREKKS